MMREWLKAIVVFLVLVAVCWCIGLALFIRQIPATPATDEAKTDAIVVLTGGSLRLDRGFELLTQGRADKMFISGVEDNITLAALLRSKEYREFEGKVPEQNVTLGHYARSTVGNADETAAWVTREKIRSIRLVTASYHMPRSIHELGSVMPGVTIIADPVFPSHFANNGWWQSAANIRLVILEYHKYVASMLVHLLLVHSW